MGQELLVDPSAGLRSRFVDHSFGIAWIDYQGADASRALHPHRPQRDAAGPGASDDSTPVVVAADQADDSGLLTERVHRARHVQPLAARERDAGFSAVNAAR